MNTPTRNVAPTTAIAQERHFDAVTREVQHG